MKTRALLRYALRTAMAVGLATLAACAAGPRPIEYGAAECAYCRMEITDPRFGAQAVTMKGKVTSFDSIECLADYVAASAGSSGGIAAYVSDWERPGTLIPIESARLLRVPGPEGSPMGQGLLAVRVDADVAALAARLGAQPEDWSAVLASAGRERAAGAAAGNVGRNDGQRPR